MKIMISPAKKMVTDTDTYAIEDVPVFLKSTSVILEELKKLSMSEAQELWKCNDRLAQLNYERIQHMDLNKNLTPAILAYEGLQYQHMAPGIFTEEALEYVKKHLRILSGFYGVLRPFDGVTAYRLEMQAKLSIHGKRDLYDFWGTRICKEMTDSESVIINLASMEYAQCVTKYLKPNDRCITVIFGQWIDGKVKQKGTIAKMARGEIVRHMAENQIENPEEIKCFTGLGFQFVEELSDESTYVFVV